MYNLSPILTFPGLKLNMIIIADGGTHTVIILQNQGAAQYLSVSGAAEISTWMTPS